MMVEMSVAGDSVVDSSPEAKKSAEPRKQFMDGTAFNLGCAAAFGLVGYVSYKFCSFFNWKDGQIATAVFSAVPSAYYAYYLYKNKEMVARDFKKFAHEIGDIPHKADRLLDKMAANAVDQSYQERLKQADFVTKRETMPLEKPGYVPPSPPREKLIVV